MPQILLLGQHGSGKSTLGRELARRDRVLFLSAGELIRAEIARLPSLRRLAAQVSDGEDAPEDFSYGLLSRALESNSSSDRLVVLDGYPRYASQIERLRGTLGGSPEAAVVLEAPTELLVHRSRTRAICPTCHEIYGEALRPTHTGKCDACSGSLINRPEDDDVEVITRRHLAWQKEGQSIVLGLEGLSQVTRIDATQSPLRVLQQVRELIGRL